MLGQAHGGKSGKQLPKTDFVSFLSHFQLGKDREVGSCCVPFKGAQSFGPTSYPKFGCMSALRAPKPQGQGNSNLKHGVDNVVMQRGKITTRASSTFEDSSSWYATLSPYFPKAQTMYTSRLVKGLT